MNQEELEMNLILSPFMCSISYLYLDSYSSSKTSHVILQGEKVLLCTKILCTLMRISKDGKMTKNFKLNTKTFL
jgi:hypothetical protein